MESFFMKNRILVGLVSFFSIIPFVSAVPESSLTIKQGDQVVQVDIQSKEQLAALEAMDLDIWSHEIGVGPIDVHVTAADLAKFDKAGWTYKVLNPDLARTSADEKAQYLATRGLATPFDSYLPLADIVTFINSLALARPDLCSVIDIGNTVEGRDIWVLKITGAGAGPKPGVFYHSLIHAREWITGPMSLYLANHLVSNYDSDPCIRALVDQTEFYIAPCANPDGYSYTWTNVRLWRKNRRNNGSNFGVDLNRNFGYQWGFDNSGSSGTTSSETYRGPSAFSEPETQAIRDFVLAHPNIRGYMDYHSYSQLLMWPWGYTPSLTPVNAKFAEVGNYMQQLITGVYGTYYEPGPVNATIYPANGVSIDWAYGAAGCYAYTIELRDTGQFGFQLPANQILPTCEENLPGILYLSRWASSGILLEVPGGPPTLLAANVATDIDVSIVESSQTYAGGSGALYYRVLPNVSFTSVPLVSQGGSSYSATMPGLTCGDTVEYYFSATGSGGYVSQQPCDAPTTLYSANVVATLPTPQVAHSYNLDSNPGWTVSGQWAFGDPAGLSGDPNTGYNGGTNVYGYNLSGDYPDNMATPMYLTTTPIDCSGLVGTQLRFQRWLGIESSQWDHATIEVSNNGSTWTTVWNFSGATLNETAWSLQTYDIGTVADGQSSVQIRWGMGPTDTSVVYHGWNIDDVEILGVPLDPCIGVMLGDMNGDAKVDGADVTKFVDVVLNPGFASQSEQCAADIDGECGPEVIDVEAFVNLLLGV
jgi:murein tripeptide amidase MpaA